MFGWDSIWCNLISAHSWARQRAASNNKPISPLSYSSWTARIVSRWPWRLSDVIANPSPHRLLQNHPDVQRWSVSMPILCVPLPEIPPAYILSDPHCPWYVKVGMGERSFLSPLACLLIANLVVSNECDESARSATVDAVEPIWSIQR